jgi:DNA-binding response OmpR family regulator
MLPPRAYSEPIPRLSPGPALRTNSEIRPALVLAVAASDVECFPASTFTRYVVQTTAEALRLVETARPRVVMIDWDAPEFDGPQICAAARKFPHTAILVTIAKPDRAPAALKAGCHGILLKPFAPNLAAARIGRLSREIPWSPVTARAAALPQSGTNRTWVDVRCPQCSVAGATSFEFSSYRRMWYACLACDAVWLGPRRE